MIEDFDVNHPQHLRQTLGDQLVSLTGFSESGRMDLCASTTAAALDAGRVAGRYADER